MDGWRGRRIAWLGLGVAVWLTPAASAQVEIVLRDSIGPNNSKTEGNKPVGFNTKLPSSWELPPITVTAPENLGLTTLRFVASQRTGTPFLFEQYDYLMMVWSSPATFEGDPTTGDLAHIVFDVPTSGPTVFGESGFHVPNYLLEFDLAPYSVAVSAGQTIVIGMQGVVFDSDSGVMGIVESNEQGNTDMICSESNLPPSCVEILGGNWTLHDGRVAVSVNAAPFCPEDLDCDGNKDLADFEIFAGAMNGPDVPRGSLGCRSNDLDGDGDLDLVDFARFQVAFGSPCE